MAWTSPSTASAGTVLTAATWNAQVRSNMQALLPLDVLAGTSYTPTVTQSSAVTKTVTRAKYFRFGNWVIVLCHLSLTGSGVANNAVTISLPVTAAYASNAHCGTGRIFASPTNFPGIALLASTTTVSLLDTTASTNGVVLGQTGSAASGALGSGNEVHIWVGYEV